MYKDTITLFNRLKKRTGDVWYATVLHNVNLNMDKSAIVAKYGAESQDNAILNIHYQFHDGAKMIENKMWLPPKEWLLQPDAMKTETITFSDGQNFDFFAAREWDGDTVIQDDDYTDGFYNYMNNKYDFVFAITSATFYGAIPHFEITGK